MTSGLDAAGVAWERNARLVRGLDYYRHTAFEFITDARGFTATQLEVSLTPALSILSQTGGSGSTNVNVRYRKDY